MTRVRILLLTRFFLSGQTTHVFSLAQELRRQGHRVALAAGNFRPERHRFYARALRGSGVVVSTRLEPRHLARLARRLRVDVVHAHSKSTFRPGLRLARRLGVPFVATVHAHSLLKRPYLRSFARADAVITPVPTIASALARHGITATVIPNGFDEEVFHPGPRPAGGPLRVLYAGRIDAGKAAGVAALCDAARTLADVELTVAANRRPGGFRGRYLGWVADMGKLMRRHDVVVGTGRAIIEGMASGTACVVLGEHLDGVVEPETVEDLRAHNFSGRARRRTPAPAALRGILGRLATDRGYLCRLQDFGRTYALAHFRGDRLAERVAEVCREAGTARRRGAVGA